MTRKISAIPEPPRTADAATRAFMAAIKEAVEVRLGRRGDPMEEGVTRRELVEAGIADVNRGPGGSSGGSLVVPRPPNASEAAITPPVPSNLYASGVFGGIGLSWERPADQYNAHAYAEVWRSETDNVEDRVMLGSSRGSSFFDRITEKGETVYYYWVRFVSSYDKRGPFAGPVGARKERDTASLLEELSGAIDEAALHVSLSSRLEAFGQGIIDNAHNIIEEAQARAQGLAAEAIARAEALSAEAAARAQGLTAEAAARAQGLAAEAIARAEALSAEAAARAQSIADVQSEIQAITGPEGSMAAMRDTLVAEFAGEIALVVADIEAITGPNGSLATMRDTLIAEFESDLAVVDSQVQAITGPTGALATMRDALTAQFESDLTVIESQVQAITGPDGALAELRDTLTAQFNGDLAVVESQVQAITGPTGALATMRDDLTAQFESDLAAIESQVRGITGPDGALAELRDTLTAQFNDELAVIDSQVQAITGPTGALATMRDALTAQFESDLAVIESQVQAITGPDGALAELRDTLTAQFNDDLAVVESQVQAITGPTGALATMRDDLTSTFDGAIAAVNSTIGALTGPGGAVTTLVDTAAAASADALAAYKSEVALSIGEGGTLASAIDSLEATVDGVSTAVESQTAIVAGLSAQFTLKLDVNGRVAGYGLYNDGATSDFAVAADRFWIAPPGSTGQIKPFVVQADPLDGVQKVFLDSAIIREASIQEGKLGPITFGKLVDGDGMPVTTLSGKLLADKIDVESLQVTDANISGVIQSSQLAANGQPRWLLDKAGGMVLNGSGTNGRMEIRDNVIKVFDGNGMLRVQLGDLTI